MTSPQELEFVRESLARRMRTMISLYYDAVDTMTLEHVNHVDAEGRLPIAFSLFHYVNMHDGAFMLITGEPPLWNDDWHARVQPAIGVHGKDRPVEEMANQRIGDLDAFADYQRVVFGRTMNHLESMDPAEFLRIVIPSPYPAQVAETDSARCAGPEGITVLDDCRG